MLFRFWKERRARESSSGHPARAARRDHSASALPSSRRLAALTDPKGREWLEHRIL